MNYRDGKRLHTLRGGYEAAVAVGLLLEGLVLLNEHTVIAVQLLVPLHGAEISRGKQRGLDHSPLTLDFRP